jgi:ankyrin repeat protein
MDVDAQLSNWWFPRTDTNRAVASGTHELIAALLVGLSSASDEFAEAFHVACVFANADVVRLFVDAGADVNKVSKLGYTAAHRAARNATKRCCSC